MSFIALWIGVLIFGLGAIFSLLSAIRTLQISRRWSDYRLRRRYVVQARGSVLLSVLSGALAVALLVFGRLLQPSVPASAPPTLTPPASETATMAPPLPATDTAVPPADTPTEILVTPSPSSSPTSSITPTAVILPTSTVTTTPVMPIAVQAMVQGTVTPAFDVQFGRLRFSTEINNYTLVAPGEEFRNPIKQMYSVFTYQPVGVKVEWTALWYQKGELKYVDTTSWQDFPPGVAVASWLRPAPEWTPGDYEVQIFVGTDWRASGRFVLEGEPPTVTPRPAATDTPAKTATASALPLPSRTPRPTQTQTAVPSATRTTAPSLTPIPRATRTETPLPTRTRTPAPTATGTTRPTATLTITPAPTSTATLRPSATPTATATRTATFTPTRTPTPTVTPTLPPVDVRIYFTNTRPSGSKTPPFNEVVRRFIPGTANTVPGVLDVYFAGPTLEEQARGLTAVRNGFVGYRKIDFVNGVLSVYLAGNCQPLGNGYSLAQPLIATLKQFPGVLHVKLYDAYDHTADTLTNGDSWPVCLDAIFTSTSTPRPTATSTFTPSRTPTATLTSSPTATPVPTLTYTPFPTRTPTPLPTRTPIPTATSTLTPSSTPRPTLTPTTRPTRTPTVTFTPLPTLTPSKTHTPAPTNTPRPTLTLTPINAPTRTSRPLSQASATSAAPGSPTATLDAACNRVEFLGDVTIVDNAILRPGESFRKTWRIRNAGDCPWTAAYKLVFVRGDRMQGAQSAPLPAFVAPGQSADVSIDLIAPPGQGQYEAFWQLQTPNGVAFGIGPTATGNLWVKIHVAGDPVPTATATAITLSTTPSAGWAEATLTAFVGTSTAEASLAAPSATPQTVPTAVVISDLASSACDAQWQANEGTLGCPGADSDPRGAVLPISGARLEGGTSITQPALLTMPSSAPDGYILGLYPQYQVQPGDRLQAVVGCEQEATACSVLFRVSYLDATGAAHDLWTLGEFHDGHAFELDLDLSDLAGQQVRFVLSVNDLGSTVDDRALWVAPRIVRQPSGADATRPAASVAPTASLTATPTAAPAVVLPSPTATAPVEAPPAPIPSFFQAVLNFFRQLFGTP